MSELVPVQCPRCNKMLGKVEGNKGNVDPNWPTEPPDTVMLKCPACTEEEMIRDGYTDEQARTARDRRTAVLKAMDWKEGGV